MSDKEVMEAAFREAKRLGLSKPQIWFLALKFAAKDIFAAIGLVQIAILAMKGLGVL